jgi:hypothetical protein
MLKWIIYALDLRGHGKSSHNPYLRQNHAFFSVYKSGIGVFEPHPFSPPVLFTSEIQCHAFCQAHVFCEPLMQFEPNMQAHVF